MADSGNDEEKTFSILDQFSDDWDDEADTEEFDMESYWDADTRPIEWRWQNPWILEPT
jgi:hypothetical protein